MKVGIIGTGNMGTIISEALLDGKAVSPSDMIVVNRTMEKAEKLKHKYEEIVVATSIEEVIINSDLIFLCVKPHDFHPILTKHKILFKENQCLVSITSPIKPVWLESILDCSCVRIIPSITNRALSGITLFTFGENCTDFWKKQLNKMFSTISKPSLINDEITRVSSDIVSCGPAFFSYITRRFIEAAVRETAIDKDLATTLTEEMIIGFGDLIKKEYYSLATLEEKVSVKGGITGEGLNILEKELDGVFEKVFQATHHKYNIEVKELGKDFHS